MENDSSQAFYDFKGNRLGPVPYPFFEWMVL